MTDQKVSVSVIKYNGPTQSSSYYSRDVEELPELINKILTSEINNKYTNKGPDYIEIKNFREVKK